ncbi:hypothetical protein ACFXGI_02700 [Streptomyces sp. NPDC059355]|uniref:hypothetical protein n=1 Tax=Streptomyces sp. NPDC059355 TaxID=3346811 RepID=UPI0036C12632
MIELVGAQLTVRERRVEMTFREHDAEARAPGEPQEQAPAGALSPHNLCILW